jgi:hypothetical protein
MRKLIETILVGFMFAGLAMIAIMAYAIGMVR